MALTEHPNTERSYAERAAQRLEETLRTLQDHWPSKDLSPLDESFAEVHAHLRKIYQKLMDGIK